jgi:hypothetical protein
MGCSLGLVGFFSMQLLWRLHLLQRIKERKLLRGLGINRFGLLHKDKKAQEKEKRKDHNSGNKAGGKKNHKRGKS